MMKANKISFVFPGAIWIAVESCGEWIETAEGRRWQPPVGEWRDPETNDCREYARITPGGEVRPSDWWHILTEEQKNEIIDFAKNQKNHQS